MDNKEKNQEFTLEDIMREFATDYRRQILCMDEPE